MIIVAVDVIVDTPNNVMPRPYGMCSRTPDGRWKFTERLVTSSPESAIEYLKHYITTKPAPLTLELVATHTSPYAGNAQPTWTALDGPRFTSGIENCPYLAQAAARFDRRPT